MLKKSEMLFTTYRNFGILNFQLAVQKIAILSTEAIKFPQHKIDYTLPNYTSKPKIQ